MKNANKQRTTRLRMDKLSQIMFALAPCLVRSRDGTYPAPVSFVHARFCLTLREGRGEGEWRKMGWQGKFAFRVSVAVYRLLRDDVRDARYKPPSLYTKRVTNGMGGVQGAQREPISHVGNKFLPKEKRD